MALRRIEVHDLPAGRQLPPGGMDPTDIPPLGLSAILSLRNAPQDVLDMPLEKFLGLKDGDTVRLTPAGPQVVRRDGVIEEINIGR